VARYDPSEGKPPPEKIMTDGCGFMNGAALLRIMKQLGLETRPSAVQGRLAGSKGLWILHPEDRDPTAPPRIWIRDSQKKIHLPPFQELSRAHKIFDHLAPARVTAHRLSKQSIVNLSHNGVPSHTLVELMEQALDEEVKRLTDWDSPSAMQGLWKAIQQAGNVSGMRTQRLAGRISRAIGLSGREFRRNDDDEAYVDELIDSSSDIHDASATAGRNNYSGIPLSMHECALELVQAGFHPLKSQFLYEKLLTVLKAVVESHVKEFRIGVAQAVEAFIVSGILDVFFRLMYCYSQGPVDL
jgi:RNA-dependent RNA polymerase